MRINSKRTIQVTLKCRPIIFATTATGGKNLKQPIQLLKKVQEIYGLSGIN
jgi:hypothetical protein